VPIALNAEQLAVQASIRQWSARAGTLAAVRALETEAGATAPGQPHWEGLARLGVFAIALPEHAGGAGGTATDLAAALEQVTDALVPGPVLPTLLAGLLLSAHAELPAVKELLPSIAAGTASVAVAFGESTIEATPAGDGALSVRGRAGLVLGAGGTTHLLLAAGDTGLLLDPAQPGVVVTPRGPVDFSRPLADVELTGAVVPPDRVVPGATAARVRDTAALLGAVEAAGVAGWCLRTAVDYAKVRQQFGRPIGAFQAVKHLCAEMLCRAERAAAMAWDAARAYDSAAQSAPANAPESAHNSAHDSARDGASAELPLAVAAACAVALDAAVDNAKDCIQVLGGIGFTWEHDAHLYLRRALALRQLLGDGAVWRERTAELALAGARRSAHPDLTGGDAEVRERVTAIAALPVSERRAALAEAGYLAPQWPAPYGLGAGPAQQLAIDEELDRAGVTRPDLQIAAWAVPTILRHGTDAQRDRFAGPSLRGELVWCQLFSEPGAGSDLAGLSTRAERAEGGWRLTGQKIWTSLAKQAAWAICVARTDPDAPRHDGISYFLVDMTSPGVQVRPLREMTGDALFNEVFLDDVFVPDDLVVGGVNRGWRVARTTLANERVSLSQSWTFGCGNPELIEAVQGLGAGAGQAVQERAGRLIAEGHAIDLLGMRVTLKQLSGTEPGATGSVRKLLGMRHAQRVAEECWGLTGPDGAIGGTRWSRAVLFTRALTIGGGTTDIQLNIIGERILGLPRDPAPGG